MRRVSLPQHRLPAEARRRERVGALAHTATLCQLVEALSRVAPAGDAAYCLDQYREVPTTEMRIIGDDVVPEDVLQQTSEPQRWRRNIVHMCLQEDPIVVSQRASDS